MGIKMLRGIRNAIPISIRRKILTLLHVIVGKPVVFAMRERSLAIEQIIDQRMSRLEARLQSAEASVEAVNPRRDVVIADLRRDILVRQDLLISMLDQRLARLEGQRFPALAKVSAPNAASVANDVPAIRKKLAGMKVVP